MESPMSRFPIVHPGGEIALSCCTSIKLMLVDLFRTVGPLIFGITNGRTFLVLENVHTCILFLRINIDPCKACNLEDFSDHFHLPLSEEAYTKFQELDTMSQKLQPTSETYNWNLPLGASNFKVSKAYQFIIVDHPVMPAIKWVWRTCCQLKHKIFLWLLLQNRRNTRAMLHKRSSFHPLSFCTCMLDIPFPILETKLPRSPSRYWSHQGTPGNAFLF